VRLSEHYPLLQMMESLISICSWLTGIAAADQGIFVRRELFEWIGDDLTLALMEDIAMGRLLK
jgi:hypothetical protein